MMFGDNMFFHWGSGFVEGLEYRMKPPNPSTAWTDCAQTVCVSRWRTRGESRRKSHLDKIREDTGSRGAPCKRCAVEWRTCPNDVTCAFGAPMHMLKKSQSVEVEISLSRTFTKTIDDHAQGSGHPRGGARRRPFLCVQHLESGTIIGVCAMVCIVVGSTHSSGAAS